MSLQVRWESIEDQRPLLDVLASDAVDCADDERFAFVTGDAPQGDGVVGWGVAARITVGTGPERFRRAQSGLSALAPPRTSDGAAGGPIAFASFTFDEEDDTSVMVVPQVVVQRRAGITWRVTSEAGTRVPAGERPDRAQDRAPDRGVGDGDDGGPGARDEGSDRPRYAGSTVRDDRWLDAVASALIAIGAGEYEKVVLARDLHLWSKRPFAVPGLLHDLAVRFPSCMTFLVDHLLGASPELLLRREGRAIGSRVLAGTAARGTDAAEDAALGAALLASEKDLREHGVALRSAVDALAPLCTALEVPERPTLIRLDNVQHLGSDLTGTLRSSTGDEQAATLHVLSLLALLHPTAAVGGEPRRAAVAAIGELEGMSRGRFAAPVGWCTPDGDGEFAIALRCAEVRGTRARLFAGAGIVEGSLPEAELTETWLKLRAMTSVLDR